MHSESNYFPMIGNNTGVYAAPARFARSGEPQILGHAKHRRDIFSKVVHSPRRKVQAQGESPLCFLPETEKKKVF